MRAHRFLIPWSFAVTLAVVLWSSGVVAGDEKASASGSLTANGRTIELPYVYVYAAEKGFYDANDPTWKLLFVEHPIDEKALDEPVRDAAYIALGITSSSEFSDEPELQVYSQDIRFSADAAGGISGGNYPSLDLQSTGPDAFAGRVYHAREQKVFEHRFQYDFTFRAPLSVIPPAK